MSRSLSRSSAGTRGFGPSDMETAEAEASTAGLRKRSRPQGAEDGEPEEALRRCNARSVVALGETDGTVKLLEDMVFGSTEEPQRHLAENEQLQWGVDVSDDGGEASEDSAGEEDMGSSSRKAVWVDEDDDVAEEVDLTQRFRSDLRRGEAESSMSKRNLLQRMTEQFQQAMGGAPSWAESTVKKRSRRKSGDKEEEEELTRRTGNFVASSHVLPSSILRMKKCCDANSACPSEQRLTSLQFHPNAQVVMTAGLDQSVSLFQVGGALIQTMRLDSFPVLRARFSADGGAVVATGLRNRMFYVYDMIEGKVLPMHAVRGLNETRVKEFAVCPEGGALLLSGTRGYLHLLTLKTKEVVSSMKMNGNVSDVTFSPDGCKVFANSEEGEVYVWDLRSSRCVNRFTDDGCVRGTSIAASRNGQYLACGSQAGVVNIYSQEACLNSSNPRPLKAVMNLLTSATSLTFNPTSEILAMASRAEDEAVRLLHLPSLSVFCNFPVPKRKSVYRVSCLDFSPNSGFFSLANNKGHAPLFRLLHYKDF